MGTSSCTIIFSVNLSRPDGDSEVTLVPAFHQLFRWGRHAVKPGDVLAELDGVRSPPVTALVGLSPGMHELVFRREAVLGRPAVRDFPRRRGEALKLSS